MAAGTTHSGQEVLSEMLHLKCTVANFCGSLHPAKWWGIVCFLNWPQRLRWPCGRVGWARTARYCSLSIQESFGWQAVLGTNQERRRPQNTRCWYWDWYMGDRNGYIYLGHCFWAYADSVIGESHPAAEVINLSVHLCHSPGVNRC